MTHRSFKRALISFHVFIVFYFWLIVLFYYGLRTYLKYFNSVSFFKSWFSAWNEICFRESAVGCREECVWSIPGCLLSLFDLQFSSTQRSWRYWFWVWMNYVPRDKSRVLESPTVIVSGPSWPFMSISPYFMKLGALTFGLCSLQFYSCRLPAQLLHSLMCSGLLF